MEKTPIFKFFVFLGRIGTYLMPLYLFGLVGIFWYKNNFLTAADPKSEQTIKFSVQSGATLEQIASELEKQKIINSASAFKWYAEKKKGATITVGEYNLSPSKKPSEIVDALYGGSTVNYEIKILGCEKLEDIVARITKSGLAGEKELLLAFKNPRLMTELGIPAYLPEGYLSEGSYIFNKPITSDDIVKKIITQSKQAIDNNLSGWQDRSSQLGYRPYEIIVLASIIEKETKSDPSQMEKISAVYHNRLKIGMQLQSGESLSYGIPTIKGEPSEADKNEETPYNTYLNIGLPPTPICSPSIAAIKAALYPSESEDLYFFKKKDGTFDYSTSFKEHQAKLDLQNK